MKAFSIEPSAFFCAGEPSGDLYAGLVIRQLKKRCPDGEILAVGAGQMETAGARIVHGFEGLLAFGLCDAISSVFSNYQAYRKIARTLVKLKPRTFVAVAYPGVNLPLCRVARRHKMRVLYLLPPQIWAWGGFRKIFLKRWVDLVISVFPFEAGHMKNLGIETVLIDNPVIEGLRAFRRTDHRRRIGFMPGSRSRQIKRNLPVINYLAGSIKRRWPDIELCLIASSGEEARVWAGRQGILPVLHQDRYQIMKNCDLILTSSGTASLEAAAMKIPQIFFHRVSFLDYHVFRKFVRIREFNLANLYYGRPIVTCYIGSNTNELRRKLHAAVLSHVQGAACGPATVIPDE
ncbi:hypothetical protein IBX73_06945 [candidate division WOR-3 bacterium]|nr:hypothetical protein [candidate division WOR-3 bacterium]